MDPTTAGLIRLAIWGVQGIGKFLDSSTSSGSGSESYVDKRTPEEKAEERRQQKILEQLYEKQREEERLKKLAQRRRIAITLIGVIIVSVPIVKIGYVKYLEVKQAQLEQQEIIRQAQIELNNKLEMERIKKIKMDELKRIRHETITDKSIGLAWVRNTNIARERMNWHDAINYLKKLNYGGYHDWRLPSKEELEYLVKKGKEDKENPYMHFRDFGPNCYWSASDDDVFSGYASCIDTKEVRLSGCNKNNKELIWPVRSIH